MQEPNFDSPIAAFGGGSTTSVIDPLVVVMVVTIVILTIILKRKYVIVPLILGILLIPYGQNLYLGGFHLYMSRLLILIGWIRAVLPRRSPSHTFLAGGFNVLDKVFLIWALCRALAIILLAGQMAAVTNQFGFLWDAVGAYFLFRSLVESEEDVPRIIKALAFVAVIASVGMIYEQMKGQNLFAFLGGVRAIPEVRQGRIRSQAFFGHALLAGAYGATTFSLLLWLWKRNRSWFVPVIGMVACCVMAYTAATSTPLLALAGAILALCLWPLRGHMRMVRWGIVVMLVGLHLVMKAPVWFLLARIDVAGGSTGYGRAMLIDNFVRHFGEWYLIGTKSNSNWGWDMWDQCNQFVAEGESGGLVVFVCFVAMFCIAYRWIGKARKSVEGDRNREWQFWILGAALFAQTLCFFGVDYFDQMKFAWYLFLAIISVNTEFVRLPLALASTGTDKEGTWGIPKRWEPLPEPQADPAPDSGQPVEILTEVDGASPETTQDSLPRLPENVRLPKG